MVKTIIQQGRREFERRGVRGWYVEAFKRLRTKPGPGRVSARRGWVGEKVIVFSILPTNG